MDAIARALFIYVFLIVLFRISGKRTLSEMTSFDLLILHLAQRCDLIEHRSKFGGRPGIEGCHQLTEAILWQPIEQLPDRDPLFPPRGPVQ